MSRTNTDVARRRLFGHKGATHGAFAMVQPQLTQTVNPALRQIGKDKHHPDRGSILDDIWQSEAFDIYDEVGEAGYVHNLTADTLTQGIFRVEKFEGGSWSETKEDRAVRVMEAFVGPRGNQNELKRAAGLLLAIAGESYLVGTPAKDAGGSNLGVTWEFLSTEEIRITWGASTVYRQADGIGGSTELGKDVYIARMWKSHPRFSRQADSAMRRLIRVGREIITLTQLVDAVANSRLNAGILFIPDEMSFASEATEDEEGEYHEGDAGTDGVDQFSEDLIEHLTAPVENRASASSLVPLIMRGPAEMGEKVRLIELGRSLDEWAMGLRQEALNRLASGLDVPREILEGLGGLNHWTGFGVDAAFVVKHVKPKGDLIADFLTVAYLRPMLEAFEGVAPTTSVKYRVVYDISALKSSLDEASNTRMVYDRGEASADALRASHGLDDNAAPTDEERQERIAIELMKAIPLLAPALIDKIRGFEGLSEIAYRSIIGPITEDTADDPIESDADPTSVNRRAGRSGGDRDGAPPMVKPGQNLPVGRKRQPDSTRSRGTEPTKTSGADEPASPSRFSSDSLVDRIATAADAALERAFERAGSRATSKLVNQSTAMRDKLAGVDKMVALTRVAPSDLRTAGLAQADLFEGAWDRFAPKAREWVRAELEAAGESGMVADERAAFAVMHVTEALDDYVAQHLHQPLPTFPNGLRVPNDLVVAALSTVMLARV